MALRAAAAVVASACDVRSGGGPSLRISTNVSMALSGSARLSCIAMSAFSAAVEGRWPAAQSVILMAMAWSYHPASQHASIAALSRSGSALRATACVRGARMPQR